VLKGAPKPALLKGRVNYQVMGANVWKHAPSLAAMAERRSRFHLTTERTGDAYLMTEKALTDTASRTLTVDLAHRGDIDRRPVGGGIVDTGIDTVDAIKFVSEPLRERMELSGLFSGQLDFITNKRDFDLYVSLSELTPNGQYVLLSTLNIRASHAHSLEDRRLLTPGRRERIPLNSIRLASRQLEAGSRLVVVLGPIKAPVLQINYGTGKDVSDETIADAKEPVRIQWFGSSFIDVPLSVTRSRP
jgi:predicted acyl esterase